MKFCSAVGINSERIFVDNDTVYAIHVLSLAVAHPSRASSTAGASSIDDDGGDDLTGKKTVQLTTMIDKLLPSCV
jgi:hypothetical protein